MKVSMVPLTEQISAMQMVIADMERVKRKTAQFERLIEAMRAVLKTLQKNTEG